MRSCSHIFARDSNSSATYKLKLTNGAIKDLQAEGGWSTMEMIQRVYTHSFEEDRKSIAQKFDDAFYSGAGFESKTNNPKVVKKTGELDDDQILSMIKSSPQLMEKLRTALA